jgi:hypothetical protein
MRFRSGRARAKHLDVQHLSGCTHRFEVFSAVVPQTKVQTLSDRGLLEHVSMAFELVADCGPNEIGPWSMWVH